MLSKFIFCFGHGVNIVSKVVPLDNVGMASINTTPTNVATVKGTVLEADETTCMNNPSPNESNKREAVGIIDDTKQGMDNIILKQDIPKKVHVFVLTNDEKIVGADVAIPITVVDEMCANFANTLYGYFIGERLEFLIVEAHAWAKYRLERAIFRNGFFFFKFSSHKGMVKTIEGGPWFIRSMSIFLNIWAANTKLKREEITKGEFCPAKDKKANSDSSSGDGCMYLNRTPTWKIHLNRMIIHPSCSTKSANGAGDQPSFYPTVIMNDSSCSINENGYFKDDIDLDQQRNNIEKLMDEAKVLDTNTNNDMDGIVDTNTNVVSTNNKSAPAEVNGSDKGSLWEQFRKSCEVSTSKHSSSMSDSKDSEVEEVCMPGVIPGGGFLDGLEDDLDCYDGYEAQVYDLTERGQAFCD
uniref:ATPase, F1/V1/A1 complex, alpha/beta subunit, zinc knuckle CX2CX4HX4C n=1 Tax=Tanacetum cinerariifolium TaxID=118510 RepID=A0A6L2JCQ9_TANCI|nr:ATPase, F1/V1/A1 complex, alpha/beta subunit, zinc knuckle CX2CX4HX4C [Tanacetum cinerariifolium]